MELSREETINKLEKFATELNDLVVYKKKFKEDYVTFFKEIKGSCDIDVKDFSEYIFENLKILDK